jgi:hypothetical protein
VNLISGSRDCQSRWNVTQELLVHGGELLYRASIESANRNKNKVCACANRAFEKDAN